jgi:nicotinate phosphoribosyltransferase
VTQPGWWVGERNQALLTDLYQLTMMQAYVHEGMGGRAVFTLFVRRLPTVRNYLLACGLDDALRFLESVRFDDDALQYLASLPWFTTNFLQWLSAFRFSGDVYAVPEGTPVFAGEPILEVEAPIAEAQFVETFLMNQIHFQTVAASKAARVVTAARGRPVLDFGLRRTHGADAGLRSARAFHVAGVAATSNVLAGRLYGLEVGGTMAHSYIQAHASEAEAFRTFALQYPETTLLVDTYDTLDGVAAVIELARELGPEFRVRAIRLDSGDLAELAVRARRMLDDAGLRQVRIFASGGLDEHRIQDLIEQGAPIDAFGVGTGMGVSSDAPTLDTVYKLASYRGEGRVKTSPDKPVLPGRKQVFRIEEDGQAVRDVIGRRHETLPGRPLLRQVMHAGERLPEGRVPLAEARRHAREQLARLPERIRSLAPADPPYPVEVSAELRAYDRQIVALARARSAAGSQQGEG